MMDIGVFSSDTNKTKQNQLIGLIVGCKLKTQRLSGWSTLNVLHVFNALQIPLLFQEWLIWFWAANLSHEDQALEV